MVVRFADVSHYQAVNLEGYFASHDRLALKVTEATGYVDPTFADRYRWCVANDKPCLLYHFDRARFSGADQFDWFLQHIRAAGGPRRGLDLLVLDSEDTNYPQGAVASARAFTARAVTLGWPEGAVYTGVWFANPNGLTPGVVQPGWRRLWISDYSNTADGSITLPAGWWRSQLIARQFTNGVQNRVYVPGIGYCDYNNVLSEWIKGETDLTPEESSKLDYVYNQIKGAVGYGQRDFQSTIEATLGTVQGVVNLVNAQSGKLGNAITDGRSAVLSALAALPTAHLDDAEIERIVQAVTDKVTGMSRDEVEAALRTVFADAATA